MALTDEQFKLGVVVVTVHTIDGESNIQDWNPKDAFEAEDYASETSLCSDVVSVDFEDHRAGKKVSFRNPNR